jgi:hypothetical protein
VQAATASRSGARKFYVRTYPTTSGLIEDWTDVGIESEIVVPTVTLDQMIADHGKPRYIKIDVEGYEYEVLKGLTEPVPYISFEYNNVRSDHIETAIACIHYLAGLGDVTLNMTPAEKLVFAYQEWLQKDRFLDRFPSDISGQRDYRYGDIFVTTATPFRPGR